MRQVREVLRLKHVCGRSGHQIAAAVGVSRYTVAEYLRRAAVVGITWPVPPELDDAALERKLFTPALHADGGAAAPARVGPHPCRAPPSPVRRAAPKGASFAFFASFAAPRRPGSSCSPAAARVGGAGRAWSFVGAAQRPFYRPPQHSRHGPPWPRCHPPDALVSEMLAELVRLPDHDPVPLKPGVPDRTERPKPPGVYPVSSACPAIVGAMHSRRQ